MTLTEKSRVIRVDRIRGVHIKDWRASNNGYYETPVGADIYSRQFTVSESHGWPKGRGVRDVGGNFDTVKTSFKSTPEQRTYFAGPRYDILGNVRYSGNSYVYLEAIPPYMTSTRTDSGYYFDSCPTSGNTAMDAKGSSFIAASIPTNSTMSASVSLAELYREGLPSMIGAAFLKDKASFFRSLGSEYLNLEFGWKPLVSDIKSAAKAIISSDDILKQLARDSGRDVHRRRYSPPEKNTSITEATVPGICSLPGQMFSGPNRYYYTTKTERSNWFSGCFTYHYDPGSMSGVESIVKQARLLYGLELTPEVLWNLAPWSWLVDWVSNVGPVLHNVSSFQSDGLVMRYGYVMEYNSISRSLASTYTSIPYGTDLPKRWTETYDIERKSRRRATPYGFGLDPLGFTTRQWSILAALGITRAPRTL